jgi:sigma-E factor negative regulatory protein RseC
LIEEQAVVLRVDGSRAHLEIERNKPCGLCGATRGCGVSLWGRLFGHHSRSFAVDNNLGAAEGDRVIVGVDEGILLSGSLSVYLLPLVLICAGGLLGSSMAASRSTSDFYAVIGALAGLLLGLAWVRLHATGSARAGRYQPAMLRRAEEVVVIRHCSR